jgi:hypothetical protein
LNTFINKSIRKVKDKIATISRSHGETELAHNNGNKIVDYETEMVANWKTYDYWSLQHKSFDKFTIKEKTQFITKTIDYVSNPSIMKKNVLIILELSENYLPRLEKDDTLFNNVKQKLN